MERFTEVLVFEGNDEDNGVTPDMTDISYRRRPATASSVSRWSRLKGDLRTSHPGNEARLSNGAWDGLLHKYFGGQQDLEASRSHTLMNGLGSETGYERAEEDYENAGIELDNRRASKTPVRRPFNVPGAQDHKKSALDSMTNMASPLASPMTRSLKLNGPKLPLLLAPVRSTMNAAYCNTIAPPATWTKCSIQRIRQKGSGKSSKFILQNASGEVILTAKRNKMEKTIRIFSPISESDPSIAESECIGIANYDTMGSRFMLHETDEEGNACSDALMALMLGLTRQGPREMKVILPRRQAQAWVGGDKNHPTLGGSKAVDDIFQVYRKKNFTSSAMLDNLQLLRTSMPVWDSTKKMFRMDFGGRVSQTSVKNMKLEKFEPSGLSFKHGGDTKVSSSVFMCGRTDTEEVFTCDFMAPLSPLEAFCIGIANLIHKPIYQWM